MNTEAMPASPQAIQQCVTDKHHQVTGFQNPLQSDGTLIHACDPSNITMLHMAVPA